MNFRVPDHINHSAVHGEVVILDSKSDRYLGLNASGAVVWGVLANGGSISEAIEAVVESFPVPPEQARADVLALVNDLVANQLLEAVTS